MSASAGGALEGVQFTEQGYFAHPEAWNEAMVPALARREGIAHLTDRHWQVIRFARATFLRTGMAPTVRLLGKSSGVSVRQLFRLFGGARPSLRRASRGSRSCTCATTVAGCGGFGRRSRAQP